MLGLWAVERHKMFPPFHPSFFSKDFTTHLKKCFTHWFLFNYLKSRLFTFQDAPHSSLFLTPSLSLSHTHSFIKAINDTSSPFRNWIWYEIYRLHSSSAQVESGTQNALIALLVKHGMWRSFFTPEMLVPWNICGSLVSRIETKNIYKEN